MNSTNKIARNTLLLSVRMVLVMLVSLYTVRAILEILGVTDFGIYNVVGGMVLLLNFLSKNMASATQRFFSYELGQEGNNLKSIFQTNLTIYISLAILIALFCTTVGFWFLNTQMNIPENRMNAAVWVYICAIFSFVFRLLSIPYQAILISYEKMGLFAWLSIVEVICLLLIVFLLPIIPNDKLRNYGILVFIVNVIVSGLYALICQLRYKECQLGINTNIAQLKKILSFTGWSLYGGFAIVLRNNGTNILLNIFFGPVINAARGIAYQAHNAIYTFVTNFTVALTPQIVKNYASGQKQRMINLIFRGSRMCYYIMLLLTIPIMLQTSYIFTLWLKEVPYYTIFFTRLVLITAIIDSITIPLTSAIEATGKIVRYQLIIGSIQYSIIPISYLLLKNGEAPYTPMIVAIIVAIITFLLKIYLAGKSIQFSKLEYLKKVVFKITGVTVAAYSISLSFILIYNTEQESFGNFVMISSVCFIATLFAIYTLGIDTTERDLVINKIRIHLFRKVGIYGKE